MTHVSPVNISNVNQIINNGISRSEATEIVRNALTQFQHQASEPLVSMLCHPGGSGGWLEALAKALGDKLNSAADKLKADAGAVNSANPGQTTQLSAEAQEFSELMSAVDNVIKTLGGALSETARKG
ncbi:hypothetical protein [Dyella subtropica]|uniref:hypothetical protein n=1 Tax=Dyella subtropica TaxID=2992127 RepID=UPI0022515658|nr:hypothetical protein [Dyella subtropica]